MKTDIELKAIAFDKYIEACDYSQTQPTCSKTIKIAMNSSSMSLRAIFAAEKARQQPKA